LDDILRGSVFSTPERGLAPHAASRWGASLILLYIASLLIIVLNALITYITPRTRPARQDDKARAFAETIAAVYADANVQAVMRQAARCAPFDPDHAAAWEREDEIKRNRRRPGRRAMYPC
jgi:hypothetical protein